MKKIKRMLKKIDWIYRAHKKWKYRNYIDKHAIVHLAENIDGKDKVAVILAGYKEELWEEVFRRISSFLPKDYDVCIVSSGKYSEQLLEIARNNGWTYISLKRNNVCAALNTAISYFSSGKYFLKIDEDIFISEHTVKNLELAYCSSSLEYNPGFMAPLIPINGFGYVEILKRFGCIRDYNHRFGDIRYSAGSDTQVESNPEVAKYLWKIKGLDQMDDELNQDEFNQVSCPIRFSIGIIYFERSLWEDMDGFYVTPRGNGLGLDEEQIDTFCMLKSRPMMVSKNSIAGHLGFGKQNQEMYNFYRNNKNIFEANFIIKLAT
ncbi:hypothetical protein FC99_GL001813 [Levilactobacillus koreensis JCM 16448]|uniref:glycosyltransferase n=1 Tax=Levilactobacillus koreensis TaxID=637971 RepID=UPI0006611E0B|nr:glycosyltransferase [Levilactobacillus koreensis]KRK86066.1 hypothetical protein FC99_GL001813 [Levilactobacillus koreensis JCM 16448]